MQFTSRLLAVSMFLSLGIAIDLPAADPAAISKQATEFFPNFS